MKGKLPNRLRWLTCDTRFILCASCLLLWWLMLPTGPHHALYLRSSWGQMSVLFFAALLLWIKNFAARLVSVGLCFIVLYAVALNLNADWETISSLSEPPIPPDGGLAALALCILWRDALVLALAAPIVWHAARPVLRRTRGRRVTLP